MRRALFTAAGTVLLAGCVADQQARPATSAAAGPVGEVVPAERFFDAVRGNTMLGTLPNGAAYAVFVAPDLTQRLRMTMGGNVTTDQGRLSAESGLSCSRWAVIRQGAPACSEHRREGDTWRAYRSDGALNATFVIRPGNPEGL